MASPGTQARGTGRIGRRGSGEQGLKGAGYESLASVGADEFVGVFTDDRRDGWTSSLAVSMNTVSRVLPDARPSPR